jgi:hypothetical protein
MKEKGTAFMDSRRHCWKYIYRLFEVLLSGCDEVYDDVSVSKMADMKKEGRRHIQGKLLVF